jgi:hypothetical protein
MDSGIFSYLNFLYSFILKIKSESIISMSTYKINRPVTITGNLVASAGSTTLGAITGTSINVSGLTTLSGGLTLASGSTSLGATTFTGAIDMGTFKITNLGTPTATADAATKGYVDSAIQGLDVKTSVKAATTTAGTLASSFANGSVIDGITLVTGDRILIKDQSTGTENGIYTVNVSGAPTRSIDFASGSLAAGTFTYIEQGTVNADAGWVCTTDQPTDVVGTNTLTFVQFSGAGSIVAGTGLTKTGNTLSVNASQTQITSVGTLTSLTVSGTSNLTTLVAGSGGFTSTAGSTTLAATTIGAITGTSATFSSTLGVTGLATFGAGGLTSTAGTTTLGATTIGAITGTSASFTNQITSTVSTGTAPFVVASTTNVANLNASSLSGATFASPGPVGSTTASTGAFTTLSASTSLTSTAGTTTLGASTIGAITGTSATFSSTLGVTGLATFGSGGLTSTAGTTTLGATTIGAITGTSASFTNQITSTLSTGTAPFVVASTTNVANLNASSLSGATFASPGPVGSTTASTGAFTTLTATTSLTSTAGTTSLGATTLSGALAMGTNKITGLGTPTASTDAATKGYVDNAIQGLDVKNSVIAATTTSGTLASSFANGSTIDGITLVTGQRILIKDQSSGIENGIYTVNASGAPTRAIDYASGSSAAGTFTYVEQGTVNADAGWLCTNDSVGSADIVGTSSLVFVQFSGAGIITAGTGLTKTGNTLSVNASQTQITAVGTLTSLTVSGTSNLTTLVAGSGGFTSTAGSTTLGASTIGAITGTSATFSSTLGVTGTTTLGAATIGAITGTSATFSSTLGVTGLATFGSGGLTSTAGTTTLGASTIGAITGTSATFSSTLGVTGLATFGSGGLTSTAGTTTLGASTIGAITGTSATFSSTLGVTGLATFGSGGLTSTAGTTTLGTSTIGAITGTSATFSTSTASTSNSTGAVVLSGGLGISNATDATSATNGGTITTAGGVAIAKSVFVGTTADITGNTSTAGVLVRGSTSGTISILPQAAAGTFNFNLPTTAGSAGQVLASAGGSSSPMTWVTPAINSAPQSFTTTGANNQTSAANVTGLVYASGMFDITMTVDVVATTSLTQLFKLSGIKSPSSSWSITSLEVSGDNSGVVFSITSGGQVQYTSSNYSGFTSLSFTWAALSVTQGITYLSLTGSSSGVVTVGSSTGTYNYNLPTTAGTSGQVLTSGGGSSSPMTWTSPVQYYGALSYYSSASQTVTTGTNTTVTWGGVYSGSSSTTGITFSSGTFTNASGGTIVVQISCTLLYDVNGTGQRQLSIIDSAIGQIGLSVVGAVTGDYTSVHTSATFQVLNSGTFTIRAFHNKGSNLDIVGGTNTGNISVLRLI